MKDWLLMATIAVGFVLFGSVAIFGAEPYTGVIVWSDGTVDVVPATSLEACEADANSLCRRLWAPLKRDGLTLVSAECRRVNSFKRGWDCIQGFNC